MADNDQMSPDASPGSKPKSGVRRVNNLPLILAALALAAFTALIAMVAVKRANNANTQQQQDVAQASKKYTDTSAMAKEVIGGHGAGVIQADAPTPPASSTAAVPIAPVNNPDAPPAPPRQANGAPAPVDPDEQQIRMAKMQMFQDAVKAKTNVPLPNQGPSRYGSGSAAPAATVDSSVPQSRAEMLARIADVRRQIDNAQSSGDPNAAYQAQLAKIRGSMGGGGGGFGGVSYGGSDSGPQLLQASNTNSSRNDIQQFGATGQSDRWKLGNDLEAPRSRFEVRAGGVIPGVMISGINSDLPGQIIGQVSQDVYDTATGKYLLIPQGTRLVGTYNSNIVYGQNAVLIAWQRLVFPDGKAMDIGAMPGADGAGYAGFRDQVNNHYVRIFASAFLMSGVTAAAAYATDRNNNNSGFYTQPTVSSELSQALGQQLGNVTAQMVAKNLNIAPTLQIRPGYRFNITVVKDLDFTKPYKSFDY
ncbi:TrbI/VirB10 family protein [Xanthomonas citri pv. citri]|uniref:TrbI/VirB10 family protein n=1 Tax=Xanthomonas TaxID=338 RepID=UPI000311BCCA|nr:MULTISPECIES: TrbI/VirB10 family protein [Xanthomonas]MBD1524592.1 TrbI/VirB10 family protein [Xanthomonas citri pv. citri]KEZ98455.1 conjugal transfer protein TrbI [Xanthomonas vasicola pv. vasculorum NCPPB 895]MBV7306614.1 TrbI/VirB10 family protein [Xanthomonas vasicola pv. vasculorum]MDO6936087.1 TrbI/VirB10 family protein [Xanthomonas vasicola]MDO6939976.1 TrbI/VirB10 family protein [Xanthomonas vasicola]